MGDTVYVQAGNYVGGGYHDATNGYDAAVYISKPLSLIGPQAALDPHASQPLATSQAVVVPSTSDPTFDAHEAVLVDVVSSYVTIQGFTLDGDNTNLTSGVVFNRADIDAAEGVVLSTGSAISVLRTTSSAT